MLTEDCLRPQMETDDIDWFFLVNKYRFYYQTFKVGFGIEILDRYIIPENATRERSSSGLSTGIHEIRWIQICK